MIPIGRYDEFLHEIFVKGNKFNKLSKDQSEVPGEIDELLREATKEFKAFRYAKPVIRNNEKDNKKKGE